MRARMCVSAVSGTASTALRAPIPTRMPYDVRQRLHISIVWLNSFNRWHTRTHRQRFIVRITRSVFDKRIKTTRTQEQYCCRTLLLSMTETDCITTFMLLLNVYVWMKRLPYTPSVRSSAARSHTQIHRNDASSERRHSLIKCKMQRMNRRRQNKERTAREWEGA